MSRRRKKASLVGRIVLIMLLALLAVLIALRYFSHSPETLPEGTAPATDAPEVIVTPAPTPETATSDTTTIPVTAAPAATAAPASTPTPQPVVVLENQGDLEIVIPEDMESDGF